MDPNANISEQRRIAARVKATRDAGGEVDGDDADRLAELVDALDIWLARGGFLPDAWQPASHVRRECTY